MTIGESVQFLLSTHRFNDLVNFAPYLLLVWTPFKEFEPKLQIIPLGPFNTEDVPHF